MNARSNSDGYFISLTKDWINQFVIRLDLCPFAQLPFSQGRIGYRVFRGSDLEELATVIIEELLSLEDSSPDDIETSFIICAEVLGSFDQYLEFNKVVLNLIQKLEMEDQFQIVTFHPDYEFADAEENAVENFTNRSPFPMFQILRQESVSKVLKAWGDPAEIPERNINVLKEIGIDEIRSWWKKFKQAH